MANSPMPLNTYFGVFGVKSVISFVVDRQVWCEHEEIVDTMRQMQVSDKGAHQARLADTRGQRKA